MKVVMLVFIMGIVIVVIHGLHMCTSHAIVLHHLMHAVTSILVIILTGNVVAVLAFFRYGMHFITALACFDAVAVVLWCQASSSFVGSMLSHAWCCGRSMTRRVAMVAFGPCHLRCIAPPIVTVTACWMPSAFNTVLSCCSAVILTVTAATLVCAAVSAVDFAQEPARLAKVGPNHAGVASSRVRPLVVGVPPAGAGV